jgi:hypothetical protein
MRLQRRALLRINGDLPARDLDSTLRRDNHPSNSTGMWSVNDGLRYHELLPDNDPGYGHADPHASRKRRRDDFSDGNVPAAGATLPA